ncbi:2-amino-3,7-dideoxy-D-threo-hept-6-ulosonate synthase [Clostridium sp. SHJSY1]|uniref:2-amino-3,7-dideoxy-D-threo-hept-6-ulosonate synthase n=1 Tax=Clostridium sp. SHJSY1 TaxID=2942483 RepID=UPI002875E496|nr:2-amino-3,7-dideoxy-D-threo-hept-6-ulosonate synthase [Clostridium sp. SHJSY1]MDS0527092.1 2-amino-3,7-dideoxy-D-threo-hept-6-ulosonate synthase [Clostridium sp. SHJSY1]
MLKDKRLKRLFNKSGRITVIPLDHGFTLGPIKGLNNFEKNIECLLKNVDSVILQKGMIMNHYEMLCDKNLGLIMHLSGNTSLSPQTNQKILTGTVEEAIQLGCDAVSIHVNVGSKFDTEMFKDFAEVSKECYQNGMPLLAMMYARGNNIESECDLKYIKHIARVAEEMGADIVKVNYTGSKESFHEVIDGCKIPVIMAGGDVVDLKTLATNVNDAIVSGARGVAIGRNVFQAKNPEKVLSIINQLVHNGTNIDKMIYKSYLEASI